MVLIFWENSMRICFVMVSIVFILFCIWKAAYEVLAIEGNKIDGLSPSWQDCMRVVKWLFFAGVVLCTLVFIV